MISQLRNYTVEIKKAKFTNNEGVEFPKTAILTYSEPDKTGKRIEEYGYLGDFEIYKLIDKHKDICLDNCYIDSFSLTEYRSSREIEKKKHIKLKSLSAKNAFFDPVMNIDLSYADIEENECNFSGSCFYKGDLLFNSSKFPDGDIDFSYAIFNCNLVDFANVVFNSGSVSFKNAIFIKGNKDFQYANFGDGDISFVNTEFGEGDVSFINAFFGDGELSFKVARFGAGRKDFHYAKFGSGDVNFERTEFGDGKVDFRKVEFNNCRVNFNRAIFGNGGLTFEGCEMKSGKFNFKKAQVGDGGLDFSIAELNSIEVFFDNSEFGKGSVNFNNSKFHKLSLRSCHLDHYIDLRVAHTDYLDLSDTVVRDILDLKPYDFPVKARIINFAGMRLIGRIYIDWQKNNVLKVIANQKDTSEALKGEQFRTLKQNFNVTGQYTDEDRAYVWFKRYEAQSLLHEKKTWFGRLTESVSYGFKWLVFDKIGLYATAPGRVLISVIFMWFIFGCLYYLFHLTGIGTTTSSVGNPDHISALMQSFYHSAITFFTIGYGDVFPQGVSRLFSAFEGFMGVFMMSYFTVAFVRKVLR